MAGARTYSVALTRLDDHLVEIEAEASVGTVGLSLSGLQETSLRETRERVRAAIINSGESWPDGQLTVTVKPEVRSVQSSSFDLAIAVAILAAARRMRCPPPGHVVFLGELGLDGGLRPAHGALPAVSAAAAAGFTEVIVPDGNAAEAALAPAIHITGAPSLTAVVRRLRRGATLPLSGRPALSGDSEGMTRIGRAVDLGQISAFAADRVLALSWTLADLTDNPQPGAGEVAYALWLRLGLDA